MLLSTYTKGHRSSLPQGHQHQPEGEAGPSSSSEGHTDGSATESYVKHAEDGSLVTFATHGQNGVPPYSGPRDLSGGCCHSWSSMIAIAGIKADVSKSTTMGQRQVLWTKQAPYGGSEERGQPLQGIYRSLPRADLARTLSGVLHREMTTFSYAE